MFCVNCHEKLNECKCEKTPVVHQTTLSHQNVVQERKGRAVVAMLCTTAMGKNLPPLLLAKAFELQGFDDPEDMKMFAMAVAVNRRRTFVTKELLDTSLAKPDLRLIPTLGNAVPKNIFCWAANSKALGILQKIPPSQNPKDALEQEIQEAVMAVEEFTSFPLVALGFTWSLTWRAEGGPKKGTYTDEKARELIKDGYVVWERDWAENIAKCTPYGQFRKMAKIGVAPLVEFFQSLGTGVFLHVGDSDPVSLRHVEKFRSGEASGLVSRYHAALDEYACDPDLPHEPCVLSGGYRVNVGKTDGATFEYLAAAVEQEMQIRSLLYDVHADLPYYTEANLLLNCSTKKLFALVDFGQSELEWNAYRTCLVKSGIITKNPDCCLALKWDPRCVLTTHAGRMHATFVSSPPKLALPDAMDAKRPIWDVCCDGAPVLRLLLLREESVLNEFARKTIEYLARAVLGQVVQSSVGSHAFAAMLFKMGRVERSSKPPTPVNDDDVRLDLCSLVKSPTDIGVFDRVDVVHGSGQVKSLKEMASDLLTPLTQVAMSSAKFKGLRMGSDKLDPSKRVIGLKQFYLLGMLGAYNSVDEEDSPIQPEEPYSIGLLPYLMGHEDVVTICETIFETVWRDVTEQAQKELLIIKSTEKKGAYKKAEELLFKFIRSSVATLYELELRERLEDLTGKSVKRFGGSRDRLCEVIPVVSTKKGLAFKPICAVPISALSGSDERNLPDAIEKLASMVLEEEEIDADLSTAIIRVVVPPSAPLDQGRGEEIDGDVWTGPSTVIPDGGVFEMDL